MVEYAASVIRIRTSASMVEYAASVIRIRTSASMASVMDMEFDECLLQHLTWWIDGSNQAVKFSA